MLPDVFAMFAKLPSFNKTFTIGDVPINLSTR